MAMTSSPETLTSPPTLSPCCAPARAPAKPTWPAADPATALSSSSIPCAPPFLASSRVRRPERSPPLTTRPLTHRRLSPRPSFPAPLASSWQAPCPQRRCGGGRIRARRAILPRLPTVRSSPGALLRRPLPFPPPAPSPPLPRRPPDPGPACRPHRASAAAGSRPGVPSSSGLGGGRIRVRRAILARLAAAAIARADDPRLWRTTYTIRSRRRGGGGLRQLAHRRPSHRMQRTAAAATRQASIISEAYRRK
ncbi:LOW QUALITY PROTEIN: hypothetical protein U9M48_025396 [Paspalum notatum var. saurae]|uniref:Uncharacterized protein n=1 Tax=Paspalum notatum var. saurae TaxID=547442 RepID=A0AAQ3TQA8_PASNO